MNKTNWIKTYLIDILPCVTILLYVLAIVYEMAFFSIFNINVLSYISLVEILISISEPLLYFSLLSLVTFVSLYAIMQPSDISILPDPTFIDKFLEKTKKLPLVVKIIIAIPLFPLYFLYVIFYGIVMMPDFYVGIFYKKDSGKAGFFFIGMFMVMLFVLSYFLWSFLLNSHNGMSNALNGLLAPLSIIILYVCFRRLFPNREKMIGLIKRIGKKEIGFFVAVYYIFTLVIFYQSGFDYGKELKTKDTTSFTLHLTDGTTFDNTNYGYINKMGNHIFFIR